MPVRVIPYLFSYIYRFVVIILHLKTDGTEGTVEKREATEFCANSNEEWTIAIGNEGTADKSAAAISGEQVWLVYHARILLRAPVRMYTHSSGADAPGHARSRSRVHLLHFLVVSNELPLPSFQ